MNKGLGVSGFMRGLGFRRLGFRRLGFRGLGFRDDDINPALLIISSIP